MRIPCNYCTNPHKFVCDCGHKHDDHNQGGGCKYMNCECTQYIQLHQRLPEETTKEFNYRILHLGKPLVKKVKQ